LSSSLKKKIENLVALHHYGNRDDQDKTSRTVASVLSDEQEQKMTWVRHPVARKHPVTGRKALYVNRLMTKKRALTKSADAVHSASIDEDLFKTTAQAAGLNPYGEKLSADEKADLGQLRNAVESAIDAEQRSTGKAIGRDRKQQIMRELTDQRVMLNTWGRDREKIAATVVNSDDRQTAYVPIGKVPPAALGQYFNYIRSVSPAAQGMTDDQIRTRFEDRLQRAYARRMIGGSTQEIQAILTGQD